MQEADIRPRELLDRYLELSAADARHFFSDPDSFAPRGCPACGETRPREPFAKHGFSYVRCGTCETLYADPAPAAEKLSEFYRDSASQRFWADTFFPTVAAARREKIVQPRIERLVRLVADAGLIVESVTDVGAGAGVFLEECQRLGLGRVHRAVEPSIRLAQQCRALGFPTFEGFADEAAKDRDWAGSADLVASFEVIEHVLSPLEYVLALRGLTRPGGMIAITGLCGTGFDILVLGKHAKAVAPPHHLNFISRNGAEVLVRRCGLDLVAFLTPGVLDVEIVANALSENPDVMDDPFLRHLFLRAGQSARGAFQKFLSDNALSSHMWLLCRRPRSS